MSFNMTYAPVATFRLLQGGDRLRGFAAPAGGTAPCLLRLAAGDTPIAFAQAGRFNAVAAAAGLRLGWCGFDVPGVRQALAIASDVTLSCGVSGDTLATIPFDPALFEDRQEAKQVLSVSQLVALGRDGEMAEDFTQILPFAIAHLHRHGQGALVEASYQTMLGRWPDGGVKMEWNAEDGQTEDESVLAYLGQFINSTEFCAQPFAAIPGPFHHAFRFDRAALTG